MLTIEELRILEQAAQAQEAGTLDSDTEGRCIEILAKTQMVQSKR